MHITSISPASDLTSQKKSVADGLEQAFVSEMLKYAGPKEQTGAFGGGIGESQFNSLLNDAYAHAITQRIDLALLPQGEPPHV